MDTSKFTAIMITKEDFDRVIMTNMADNLHNPHFEGKPDAAMLYSLGGATFAREVRDILFGREEHHDQ